MKRRTRAPEPHTLDVPFWALTHFGKPVTLYKPFGALAAGSTAILDGVTHVEGGNRALLMPDPEDPGYLEDVPFDHLEAPGMPFDLWRGIPGRLGEIAFLWAHGFDLRKRISKATFYRYRRDLLRFSIDINRPLVATKGHC